MSYHGFNNLSGLLNGDLIKTRRVINCRDFMDRSCNYSNPYKVDYSCDFEVQCHKNFQYKS